MAKFRKKPVVIDAVMYPLRGCDRTEFLEFMDAYSGVIQWHENSNGTLTVPTLEGDMTAQAGDFIIRGVKGEIYPCKPDIFAATYEPA